MATQKQLEANRQNALKSTGPKTEEGKQAVRFNALRHGLRAGTILLPGENLQKYWELCDEIGSEWQPQGRTELFFAEQMVAAQWKLRRMELCEHCLYRDSKNPTDELASLERLWQAQLRLERSFTRALHELERLQSARHKRVILQAGPNGLIVHEPPEPSRVEVIDLDEEGTYCPTLEELTEMATTKSDPPPATKPAAAKPPIGRASCRERV